MKRTSAESERALTEEERETVEALVNYPSLERAFAETGQAGAQKIRRKMLESIAEFERVVRRGARAEAERADAILTAYKTTLGFLDELEEMQKNQSR
jgi:hypothetical protein